MLSLILPFNAVSFLSASSISFESVMKSRSDEEDAAPGDVEAPKPLAPRIALLVAEEDV